MSCDIILLKQLKTSQLQQSFGSYGVLSGHTVQKIKVSKPSHFGSARSAKELENFLWDMGQYFSTAHIPEGQKVSMTMLYLTEDAKLWWRTRVLEVCLRQPKIETLEKMKAELKKQFLPNNTSWLARDSLRKLKHPCTVHDYVKNFLLCCWM